MFEGHGIFDRNILLLGIRVVSEIVVEWIVVAAWGAEGIPSESAFVFLRDSALVTAEFVHVVFQSFVFHDFPFFAFEVVELLLFYALAIQASVVHVVDELVPF